MMYGNMKTSMYMWLVGINTIYFTSYALYKYYNKVNDKVNDKNSILQIEIINNKKMEVYNDLLSKNIELDQLIAHLNNIQDNITLIREKLEDSSTKSFTT